MPTKLDYINELERRYGRSPEIDELRRRYTSQEIVDWVLKPDAPRQFVDIASELELPIGTVEQIYDPSQPPAFDDYGTVPSLNLGFIRDAYTGLQRKDIPQFELVEQGDQQYLTLPRPRTTWEKIKGFFIGGNEEARWTKKGRYEKFHDALSPVMYISLRGTIGRCLEIPQLGWAIVKRVVPENALTEDVYNMDLIKAMGWAANYNPSGFTKLIAGTAEILGGAQTAGEIGARFNLLVKGTDWGSKALRAEQIGAIYISISNIVKSLAGKVDTGTDYGENGIRTAAGTVGGFGLFSMSASLVKAGWKLFLKNHPKFGKLVDDYFFNKYKKAIIKEAQRREARGETSLTPEQQRKVQESHLKAKREVLEARKIFRETGDKTQWDRVRAYYTGLSEGKLTPSPSGDVTVKDFGKYPIVKTQQPVPKTPIAIKPKAPQTPKINTRAIGEVNKQILNNEAYKFVQGEESQAGGSLADRVPLNVKQPYYIDPKDWGEIRDVVQDNPYLKKIFKKGKPGDRKHNFKIDEWANENFIRASDTPEEIMQYSDKLPGRENVPDVSLFVEAIQAAYAAKRGGMEGKISRSALDNALASNHPMAVELEWLVRKKDLLRQGLSKEEIDFAEQEYYNNIQGEYDAYKQAKEKSLKAPTPTDIDTASYEAEERRAIQEESKISEADISDFLEGITSETPPAPKRSVDLLGRVELKGGAKGKQQEFLDKEQYKTLKERERIVAENDLVGQQTFLTSPKKGKGLASGFALLPPVSVVNEIGAEHPNIDVPYSQKDIGILQNYILTPVNQASHTGNLDIIKATQTMALAGIKMNNEIRAVLHDDQAIYKSLPRGYKKDNGKKFFELMDKHFSPEEIDQAKDIPDKVKVVLKHFKLQDENVRQEIIKQKRKLAAAAYRNKTLTELQRMAVENDIAITKQGKTKRINRTKAELSEELANKEISNEWGRQWSHIQHIFFGQYELFYTLMGEKGPEKHFIGRAETRAEAYQKLLDWKNARKAAGYKDYNTIQLTASPEINIPLDVLRLSKGQYGVLRKQLKEAADMTSQEISDALKGVISTKARKQKWWGALMFRTGKSGFSTDFWKVWSAQTTQFVRWKHLNQMNKDVEPLIEKVRAQGLTGWANYLEDTKNFIWGTRRSVASKALDQLLERIPVLGDYVKPFALERWAGLIKSFQYWTKLQTGRFYVLNSLQPLQTLWPVVGEKGLYKGFKLYYSKEGQELLKKYNVSGISGKLHETLAIKGRKFERYTPAGASEIRNQGVAFLSLFDYAKTKLGYTDADAARYGILRGQLFTQFTYTGGDVPRAMRGPIGGVVLQFKRFQVKNLELFSRLIREGNYGGAARWVAALGLLGGVRLLTSSLSLIGAGAYVTKKIYDYIKKEYGEDVADTIAYGIPALLGVDMSGSLTPLDVPYGRNIPEKIGNTILGASGQQIVRLFTDMASDEVAKEVGLANRALKSIAETSPTIKQFQFLVKALQKDTSTYDTRQRKRYKLEVVDLWKKAFGFRPVEESRQRMIIEAMIEIKMDYDDVCDSLALSLIELGSIADLPDDYTKWPAEAKKILSKIQRQARNWQATYPEFSITSESVLERIKNRTEAREFTQLQREWVRLSKNLKKAFVQDVKQKE